MSKSSGISGDGKRRIARRGEAVAGSTDSSFSLRRRHREATVGSLASTCFHSVPCSAAPRDSCPLLFGSLASYGPQNSSRSFGCTGLGRGCVHRLGRSSIGLYLAQRQGGIPLLQRFGLLDEAVRPRLQSPFLFGRRITAEIAKEQTVVGMSAVNDADREHPNYNHYVLASRAPLRCEPGLTHGC